MMTYKGYTGVAEVGFDDGLIFGEVQGLRDMITFQGRSVEEARRSFEESVDAYLGWCAAEGRDPEKPYSGKFLARIDPDLHRDLARLAARRRCSLNDVVAEALAIAVGHLPAPAPVPEPTWQEVKAALRGASRARPTHRRRLRPPAPPRPRRSRPARSARGDAPAQDEPGGSIAPDSARRPWPAVRAPRVVG